MTANLLDKTTHRAAYCYCKNTLDAPPIYGEKVHIGLQRDGTSPARIAWVAHREEYDLMYTHLSLYIYISPSLAGLCLEALFFT